MDLKKYKKICKINNQLILNNYQKNPYILSINLLSVIKENPVFYSKLNQIFLDSTVFFYLKQNFLCFINFIKILIIFFLSLFSKTKQIIKSKKKYKYVFISHLFKKKNEDEIYFKKFLNKIKSNSYKFYYLNHFYKSKKYLRSNFFDYNILTLKEKIEIFKIVFSLYFYLRNIIKKNNSIMIKKILRIACSEIFATSTFNNIKIQYEIEKILSINQITKIYSLFEGSSLERLIFYRLKKKNIKICGYQHTGLSKNQNSCLKLLDEDFYPDYLLTKSLVDKKRFSKCFKLKDKKKIVYFGKIKKKKKQNWKYIINNKNITNCNILFLADGDEDEFNKSISFCSLFSSLVKKNITIRTHPIHKIGKIKNYNQFKFSNLPLEKDFDNNDVVFYRNSSTVFNAIEKKIFPVFIDLDNLINNPLYFIPEKKNSICSKENVNDQLNIILNNMRKINYNNFYYKAQIFFANDFSAYKFLNLK